MADDLYDLADDDAPKPQTRPRRTPRAATLEYSGRKKASGDAQRLTREERRKAYAQETALEDERRDWLVPLVTLGVVAVIYLVGGLIYDGITGAAGFGVYFGIATVMSAFTGTLAAFASTLFGVGFGGRVWTVILRLAAACMAASVVGLFLSVIPLGCLGLAIYLSSLVIALMTLLDLDVQDARTVTILVIVISLGTNALVALALGDFGGF